RMLARMFREVDPLPGDAHRRERGVPGRLGIAHHGQDGSVVCGVGLHVQELYARDIGHRRAQRVDRPLIAALGKVRYTFHERSGGDHQLFLTRSMSHLCIAELPATTGPSVLSTSVAPSGRVMMPPASRMSK